MGRCGTGGKREQQEGWRQPLFRRAARADRSGALPPNPRDIWGDKKGQRRRQASVQRTSKSSGWRERRSTPVAVTRTEWP